MNIDLYLEKLKLKKKAPTLEYLNELISAHQAVISFNNLAVFFYPGKILDLELAPLFEKVVLTNGGGYCHENNKVFYYLLKDLGFSVEAKLARVILDRDGDLPRSHRTTIVSIKNERFLADVGFGRHTPNKAVPLKEDSSGTNYIVKTNGLYTLKLNKEDSYKKLYTFDDGNYQESDFDMSNYFTNTHPSSKFTKELIVTRNDYGVVELISGKIYSRIENNQRVNFEIKNQEEFQAHLRKFGVDAAYDFTKIQQL